MAPIRIEDVVLDDSEYGETWKVDDGGALGEEETVVEADGAVEV